MTKIAFFPLSVSYCSCEYGGWSRYDAEKYQLIMEQYPSSSSSSSTLPNRRAVVIDRVKRELPSKTRADIVSLCLQSPNVHVAGLDEIFYPVKISCRHS